MLFHNMMSNTFTVEGNHPMYIIQLTVVERLRFIRTQHTGDTHFLRVNYMLKYKRRSRVYTHTHTLAHIFFRTSSPRGVFTVDCTRMSSVFTETHTDTHTEYSSEHLYLLYICIGIYIYICYK